MRHFGLLGLVLITLAGPSGAADAPITLQLSVDKIILLEVLDRDIELAGTRGPEGRISSLNMAGSEARAEFVVTANADYDLTVTVPETWALRSGPERLVKFRILSDYWLTRYSFIGGSIFLDTDLEDHQPSVGLRGIVPWDSASGALTAGPFPAGRKEYGLGVDFDIDKWRVADFLWDAGGFAWEGTYSTTATVTASTR